MHYSNNYYVVTTPRYLRIGGRCADSETENLRPRRLRTQHREEKHRAALPHMFILVNIKETLEYSHFTVTHRK